MNAEKKDNRNDEMNWALALRCGAGSFLIFMVSLILTGGLLTGLSAYPLMVGFEKNKNFNRALIYVALMITAFVFLTLTPVFSILYVAIVVIPVIALSHAKYERGFDGDQLADVFTQILMLCALSLLLIWVAFDLAVAAAEAALRALEDLEKLGFATFTPEQIQQSIPFIPGFYLFTNIGLIAFSYALAQNYLIREGVNLKKTHLSDINFPYWLWPYSAVIYFISILFMGFNQNLMGLQNLTFILTAFFSLQGWGVVTAFQKKKAYPLIVLVIFFFCVLVFPLLSLFLVGLGIFEPFTRLREKIKNAD